MAKKDNLKELKAIGEELYEILAPEDEDTGEEMELDEFLLNGKKKLNAKVLEANLVEFCEALEEEDGDEASEELMAFMEERDIDIPWTVSPDDVDDDYEEEEEPDDDEEEDEEEDSAPDFDKMSIPELKAFAKENKIKGIAGLKKKELINLITSEYISPSDEEEPDDVDDDDIDEEEEESKYEDVSTKELKKLLKKAGHSPKDIKTMDRDEMIEHLEAADDADEDDVEEEEEKELTLEEQLNETTKLSDLKDMVEQHDEFKKIRKKAKKIKGLQGPRELKPLMYKALGVEAPAKQKRGPKKDKAPVYKRADSVVDGIKKIGKKGFTMQELIDKSDEIYTKKTGGSSSKNFYNTPNNICHGLVGFGILEKEGSTFKLA